MNQDIYTDLLLIYNLLKRGTAFESFLSLDFQAVSYQCFSHNIFSPHLMQSILTLPKGTTQFAIPAPKFCEVKKKLYPAWPDISHF